jgi:hypothetical protein
MISLGEPIQFADQLRRDGAFQNDLDSSDHAVGNKPGEIGRSIYENARLLARMHGVRVMYQGTVCKEHTEPVAETVCLIVQLPVPRRPEPPQR